MTNGDRARQRLICRPYMVALLALLCCALWGSAYPCVKLGYEWFQVEGAASQILFAGYRFTLAGIVTLAAGCLMERRFLTVRSGAVPSVIVLGLCQTTLQYVLFYIGLSHTTGSKGSVINATNVFFSLLIAHFAIPGERLTWKKSLGCILGLGGLVLINISADGFAGGFHLLGEGLLMIMAVVAGASAVLVKFVSQKGDPVAIFGFANPIFGIVLSGVILGEHFVSVKNMAALVLVCAGILLVNLSEGGSRMRSI